MKKRSTSPTPAKAAPVAREINGADCVVECLLREQVEAIFAYPGGSSLELHQAFARSGKIRTILPRHEQGGAFAANAYARASGKVGVCMATSGPGATNLVSGIADAYMDSIPMVAITGQVFQKYIGKMAFQETDFFGMTLPVVKHSFLVLKPQDLPRVFKEAFEIALSGRPGPVVIDIPKDVQQARFVPEYPSSTTYRNPWLSAKHEASDEELEQILGMIAEARRPMLYVGGGVVSANAHKDLQTFAEKTRIPVATTLMGVGAFPETHPLSTHWFGMHGAAYSNWAVDQSDLLIVLGARFDDRITGDTNKFAAGAKIVHIDIDASEHNKNKKVLMPVLSEVKYALARLNKLLASGKRTLPDTSTWIEQINKWKSEAPFTWDRKSPHIQPQEAIEALYELTKGEAIITTGVGQHQMWTAQHYRWKAPRRYISSLGLGAMGFGYPAALGAKVACPDREVIDIDGDGSFLMNVQELATAAIEKIAAKVIILNNQHLGMVVQWEDRFYNSLRGNTILGDANNIGSPDNPAGLYPDFVKIAEGFGVKGRRILNKKDLRPALKEMLAHDGPYVLDIVVPYTNHVLPMIPAGRSVKDMLLE